MQRIHKQSLSVIFLLGITACEDGSTPTTQVVSVAAANVSSLELLDPTPGASDEFGALVVQLTNGNIVVSDPGDSSIASNNGAVHLYSPFESTPIASIYGDMENDSLGSTSITALHNGNYVIASEDDDESGTLDVGSVRLVDGATGEQIGATLAGDGEYDNLGSSSVTALPNNHYVVASSHDTVDGISNAGSVRLMNGNTGEQIGVLSGDTLNDELGLTSVTALPNSNYVIASGADDESNVNQAGSVRLVSATTGLQIGVTIAGDTPFDSLGDTGSGTYANGITALPNNNYVVASPDHDIGSLVNAGSVRLMDGDTGEEIAILTGDDPFDRLGSDSITVLANNNYVIASPDDDEGAVSDAGSVRLMDADTGEQIGITLTGDIEDDRLGSSHITALPNNNYVIASQYDEEDGIPNAGSVRLIDGSTGAQIDVLAGDLESDNLGSAGITALLNNNYVIASPDDDDENDPDNLNLGSVRLMNGGTGDQISIIAGDVEADELGSDGITALLNNNYVIASSKDNEAGQFNPGTVRLMDGITGVQIAMLAGNDQFDLLGSNGSVALSNNNYVIVSKDDDEDGIPNAGSVWHVNGSTGATIGLAIIGTATGDMTDADIITPVSGDYYILTQPFADKDGQEDAGRVRIIAPD